MQQQADLERLIQSGLVAVVRADSGESLLPVAEALLDGGVECIEITFTVPGAADVIAQLDQQLGSRALIGAGTVTTIQLAELAIDAGARFLVSPVVDLAVMELAKKRKRLIMPGALTPTEVLTAWNAGADIVKIFPGDVGGPSYLKALHGPFPEIKLMPTGGVNLDTADDFLKAGACALGVGGALVSPRDIADQDYAGIQQRARQFVEIVRRARAS